MSTAPRTPKGHPAVSCYALAPAELRRRSDAAHQAVEDAAKAIPAAERDELSSDYLRLAQRTLWHEDFPTGFRLYVCDADLFRLTAYLALELPEMNQGRPLDYFDYGYLADVLRAHLADCRFAGDAQNLRRALAWVKRQGRMQYIHGVH